jgi:hypothetical protein
VHLLQLPDRAVVLFEHEAQHIVTETDRRNTRVVARPSPEDMVGLLGSSMLPGSKTCATEFG